MSRSHGRVGLNRGVDADRHSQFGGLGPERIVVGMAVGEAADRMRGHKRAPHAVPDAALQLGHGPLDIAERDMGDGDQPVGGVGAEIDDPAVIGPTVGVAQGGVKDLGFPQQGQRGVQHRGVHALLIHVGQAFPGVHGAQRGGAGVGAVGPGHEFPGAFAVAADGEQHAPGVALGHLAVDLQILQTARVGFDADRAVTEGRVDVALPQVGRLKDMGVGVNDQRIVSTACHRDRPFSLIAYHSVRTGYCCMSGSGLTSTNP